MTVINTKGYAGPKCSMCNDSGTIACSTRTGLYRHPGPVPDDARGVFESVCYDCDARYGEPACLECGKLIDSFAEEVCKSCRVKLEMDL